MKRTDAIDLGLLTYTTTKSCRRGHAGERYTSNGMCVQCLKERGKAQADDKKMRRMIRNTRIKDGLIDKSINLRGKHEALLDQIVAILNNDNQDHIARVTLFVGSMAPAVKRSDEWCLADILAAGVETDGHGVTNMHRWETDHNNRICVQGVWFDGVAFMAVVRGHIQWVHYSYT